jgi:hypothetical protein
MRYAFLLLTLVGCQTSADQRDQDRRHCLLDYAPAQLATCLTVKFGWTERDALQAQDQIQAHDRDQGLRVSRAVDSINGAADMYRDSVERDLRSKRLPSSTDSVH